MHSKVNNSGHNQLGWAILLLIIAVVLPILCLLWFMARAVTDGQLAYQQKLINLYDDRAETFFVEYHDNLWRGQMEWLASAGEIIADYPPQYFADLIVEGSKLYCGAVVYDSADHLIWPLAANSGPQEHQEQFKLAWELEYASKSPEHAFAEYEKIVNQSEDFNTRYLAAFGQIRCLKKQGKSERAIEIAYRLSYPASEDCRDIEKSAAIMRAKVRLAQLYAEYTGQDEDFYRHLRRCLTGGSFDNENVSGEINLAADVEIWGLSSLVEIAQGCSFSQRLEPQIISARRKIETRTLCFDVAGIYPDHKMLLPAETVCRLDTERELYGFVTKYAEMYVLLIISPEFLKANYLKSNLEDINDDTVTCCIYDDTGDLILGDNPGQQVPFVTKTLGKFMPGFTAKLYFRDDSVIERAARRQSSFYLWLGVGVVLLIIACGAISAQILAQQIKLSRLKNNFIATVTHELKTPLSSMRVLVDTLLDGNYKDQEQATEYLQLISRENIRLSRLIDNFLTFSRMERNKQVFDITAASASEIAQCAADALRTKFSGENCNLTVNIDANLPSVMADKDSMVTVLINLLDNAYKYSGEIKQISLSVNSRGNRVYFCVKDNGIGMSRRQIRKIFDRFYQADSSLSRRTEGAGLGLSIVKFIVDSHKGDIKVESEIGVGSKISVTLPVHNYKSGN